MQLYLLLHCIILITEKTKVLHNLGSTYTYLCNFTEAEQCFTQALDIGSQNFDDKSETWNIVKSDILKKMGVMKRKKGEATVALELLKHCEEMKKPKENRFFNLHQLGKCYYVFLPVIM